MSRKGSEAWGARRFRFRNLYTSAAEAGSSLEGSGGATGSRALPDCTSGACAVGCILSPLRGFDQASCSGRRTAADYLEAAIRASAFLRDGFAGGGPRHIRSQFG